MNNYVQQKLEEWKEKFVPKIIAKNVGEQLYADKMRDVIAFEQEKWIEQALKDTVREVLKEAEMPFRGARNESLPEYQRYREHENLRDHQKQRHQQILNNL